MDFMNRNVQQPARPTGGTAAGNGAANANPVKNRRMDVREYSKWFRVSSIVLLFSITVLIAAIAGLMAFGGNGAEGKFVNKKEYQAVFINVNGTTGGQVYFGHIADMNAQFVRLTNVFYIQNQANSSTNKSQSSNSAYTLVKLGCELHGPEDQMVINRDQVYFWENLKDSSQVAQKIGQFYKDNPNGQQCSSNNASQSTQQSSTTPQSSTNTNSSNNNASSTKQ